MIFIYMFTMNLGQMFVNIPFPINGSYESRFCNPVDHDIRLSQNRDEKPRTPQLPDSTRNSPVSPRFFCSRNFWSGVVSWTFGHGWYTDIILLKELKLSTDSDSYQKTTMKSASWKKWWWFYYFFGNFTQEHWGNDPSSHIFFNWVESTNYLELLNNHDLNGWNWNWWFPSISFNDLP